MLLVYVTRLKRGISGRFECLLSPAFPAAGCILHVHAHAFPPRHSVARTRSRARCLLVQGQRFAQVPTGARSRDRLSCFRNFLRKILSVTRRPFISTVGLTLRSKLYELPRGRRDKTSIFIINSMEIVTRNIRETHPVR